MCVKFEAVREIDGVKFYSEGQVSAREIVAREEGRKLEKEKWSSALRLLIQEVIEGSGGYETGATYCVTTDVIAILDEYFDLKESVGVEVPVRMKGGRRRWLRKDVLRMVLLNNIFKVHRFQHTLKKLKVEEIGLCNSCGKKRKLLVVRLVDGRFKVCKKCGYSLVSYKKIEYPEKW